MTGAMLPMVLTRLECVPRVSAGPVLLTDPGACTPAKYIVVHRNGLWMPRVADQM
jgi:hypothetical protein